MTTIAEKLSAYEVDVDFPEVSGMEQLQMLLTRSELHRADRLLDSEQKTRLARADRKLVQQAQTFYEAIQGIADLASWRERAGGVTPEHWWWYVDVLAHLPAGPATAEVNALAVRE
ncbi:MAG: hypothetical protein F4Z82_11145 [Caldilineaceae bacterium SB0668_bin_21]|nr:hypothetical protein [Caldilineaceae bacterium SB0668_bin_21]MYC23361.1 hypothetical protein [Caldilineaceae bacterium SB0662_bin_25]